MSKLHGMSGFFSCSEEAAHNANGPWQLLWGDFQVQNTRVWVSPAVIVSRALAQDRISLLRDGVEHSSSRRHRDFWELTDRWFWPWL